MTANEALVKIKQLFAEDAPVAEAPAEAPAAPKEYQLADGTPVLIDTLSVGGKVALNTPEGPIPAPAGSHTLMDGQVLTVDESGMITAIDTPQAEAAPVDAMMAKVSELEAQLAEIKAHYQTRFEEQEQTFSAALEDQKNKVTGLKEIIEQMMTTPVADPIQRVKHYETRDEKIAKFLEFTKKIK